MKGTTEEVELVESLIDTFDKNKDGELSIDEFIDMMENYLKK